MHQPPGRMALTGLRIDANLLRATVHFVVLDPTVRFFVRARSVALAKRSQRVRRRVLIDEILYNSDLSTTC